MNANAPKMPFTAGISKVNVGAKDLGAEIEARLDAALQQALDKARDRTGRPDPKIDQIHLGDVFEMKGEHYIKVVVFLPVNDEGTGSGE